ncbi:replication-associated protein [Cressdnaviricota sp.]|uniref:Replication-associated protein n=1 Tax=Cressdnaviricota sp. TaxID=2748378 RepID=A0ABX6N1F0_9VIRU|nr:replication-associated protein [Cressdnaviricota sp.]QJQ37747.1 replication-associated protein [Cressdnaviricota sp.]
MAAATSWTGTWFCDDDVDLEQYLSKLHQDGKVAFCIGQAEQCPQTGRKHLQFYVQLGRTCTMKWLKKYVNEHAHWEKARGSVDENIQYCSKLESRIDGPWQFGVPKRTGKLTGLDEATMLVTSGTPLGEVAKAFPEFRALGTELPAVGVEASDPKPRRRPQAIRSRGPGTLGADWA